MLKIGQLTHRQIQSIEVVRLCPQESNDDGHEGGGKPKSHNCARDIRWKQRRSFRNVPVQQEPGDQHGVLSFLAHMPTEAPVRLWQHLKQMELRGKVRRTENQNSAP